MWGKVRAVVEPGSGLWSLPRCLDVRVCLGTGGGEAAASDRKAVRIMCARLRIFYILRKGGLFRVKCPFACVENLKYIYT